MRTPTRALILLASLLLVAASVHATPITVLNGDFESPAMGTDDTFTSGVLPNWSVIQTSGGNLGVERLAISHFASGQPRSIDGNQVAYSNNGPHVFSQTLGATVTANTIYTLSLSIGDRNDTAFIGYTFGLFAGANTLISESDAVTPADGTWVTRTLIYTVLPTDPNIGQSLTLHFGSTKGTGGQTVFDAYTIDASPVPEPSMCALALLGTTTLLRRTRSR